MEENKNRKFPIFIVHGNLKWSLSALTIMQRNMHCEYRIENDKEA